MGISGSWRSAIFAPARKSPLIMATILKIFASIPVIAGHRIALAISMPRNSSTKFGNAPERRCWRGDRRTPVERRPLRDLGLHRIQESAQRHEQLLRGEWFRQKCSLRRFRYLGNFVVL